MKILGISSVTRDCGVAIIENGTTLGHFPLAEGRGLSEALIPAIRDILAETGLSLESLDGIAVTAGPGSFTGIKVGLAAAKGLSFTLRCKVAGISTLEALAWSIGHREHPVYSVINAGRGEIFAGCYRFSDNTFDQRIPDNLYAPEDLIGDLTPHAFLVGDAAPLVYNHIPPHQQTANIRLLPAEQGLPLPIAVAQRGMARIAEGNVHSAVSLSPLYIRRAEAEVQLEKKQTLAAASSCTE